MQGTLAGLEDAGPGGDAERVLRAAGIGRGDLQEASPQGTSP